MYSVSEQGYDIHNWHLCTVSLNCIVSSALFKMWLKNSLRTLLRNHKVPKFRGGGILPDPVKISALSVKSLVYPTLPVYLFYPGYATASNNRMQK